MGSITGVAPAMAEIRRALKNLEREAMAEVQAAATAAMNTAMSRTPVWEGETVRNYRWTRGKAPAGGTLSPVGTMDPGPTNSMGPPPAGEPRRAGNEAAAMSDMLAVMKVPRLTTFTLTNTVNGSKWDMIDNGSAPGGPGQARRGPGGISKLAAQVVRARGVWK